MNPVLAGLTLVAIAVFPSASSADICSDIEMIYDQAIEGRLKDWAGSRKGDGYISKFRLDGASSCEVRTPYDDYLGEYRCTWNMGGAQQLQSAFKSVSQAIQKCPFLSGGELNENALSERKSAISITNTTVFSFHSTDYSKNVTIFVRRTVFKREDEDKHTFGVDVEIGKPLK